MTFEMLTCLIPSYLAAVGVWIAVFMSPLVPHAVGKALEGLPYTSLEFENYLMGSNRWFLYGVWTCLWCQAFWTAVLTWLFHVVLYSIEYYPFTATAGAVTWAVNMLLGPANPFLILALYPLTTYAVWKTSKLPSRKN